MAFDFVPKGDNEGVRDYKFFVTIQIMSLEAVDMGKCTRQYLAMANMLSWKTLGGGRWKAMHYMIMDSELRYKYELKFFLHAPFHIWSTPDIHVQIGIQSLVSNAIHMRQLNNVKTYILWMKMLVKNIKLKWEEPKVN